MSRVSGRPALQAFKPIAYYGFESVEGHDGEIGETALDMYLAPLIAHVRGVRVPGQPGSAILDIFRLEDGKIVERWDAIQPAPERSANPNGML
ncbi:hypothetical protein ACIQ9E_23660 [Streptomyces sp. NPDC094448]|uniref:nuclear transport factor 2 family protein n=1 Tax=Streptomyces sp. NPDC094448 TaxID=3366063 RepID=UPI0037F5A724